MALYDLPITDIIDIETALKSLYIYNRAIAVQNRNKKGYRTYHLKQALRYYRLYRIIKDTACITVQPSYVTDETIIKDKKLHAFTL